MTQPRQYPGQMVSRMPAGQGPGTEHDSIAGNLSHPKFDIVIDAADGTRLVHMFEDEHGRLRIEGEESRWDEGAMRFLHGMMTWSGQVGIPWKDEVKKAAG